MINKILLLGSTGFVGTNFLKDRRASHYKIFSPKRKSLDLTNKEQLFDYVNYHNPDLIINAAGKVGGIMANSKNNFDFLNENILINYNIINVSKELKVKNLINLSSSCIYPVDYQNPFLEEDILNGKLEPTNEGYALSKIYALKSCDFISKEESLNFKTFIPCNLYGPYDDFNEDTSHMIPATIARITNSKKSKSDSVKIWGTGEVRREFMFIDDFIDFLYFSIEKFEIIPSILNVGLGFDYSIKEYYKIIMSVIEHKAELVNDLSKPDGIKRKLMNISKLKKLGWEAQTSLTKGIKLTYKFYIDNYANQL